MTTTTWQDLEAQDALRAADAVLAEPPQRRPAAAGSALAAARKRRDGALGKAHLDLAVPGMEGFFVRYRAIEFAEMTRVQKRHEKSKADDRDLIVNATVLALCCVGVGMLDEDGRKVSADPDAPDDWPRFDERLATLLEVDAEGAVPVLRALYGMDGHVFSAAGKLTEWSGYALEGVEEVLSGG